MVWEGETVLDSPDTDRRPLSIVLVGVGLPVTTQERSEDCPFAILEGIAVNPVILGEVEVETTPPTVTIVWAVAVAVPFDAVKV